MDCPACGTAMLAVERHRIEVDYCAECRGLWFDAGEMKLLAHALGLAPPPDFASRPPSPSSENRRGCPRCRGAMDKVLLGPGGGAVVDRCPGGDGLWFDAGELGKVLTAPPGGAVERFLSESFAALKEAS